MHRSGLSNWWLTKAEYATCRILPICYSPHFSFCGSGWGLQVPPPCSTLEWHSGRGLWGACAACSAREGAELCVQWRRGTAHVACPSGRKVRVGSGGTGLPVKLWVGAVFFLDFSKALINTMLPKKFIYLHKAGKVL